MTIQLNLTSMFLPPSYNMAATPKIPAIAAPTPITAAVGWEPTPPVVAVVVVASPAARVADDAASEALDEALVAILATLLDAPAAALDAAPAAPVAAVDADSRIPDAPVWTALAALLATSEMDARPPEAAEERDPRMAGSLAAPAMADDTPAALVARDEINGLEATLARLSRAVVEANTSENWEATLEGTAPPTAEEMAPSAAD